MMEKIYIGTNTKMYKTIADTLAFLERLGELTVDISRDRLELFVIPSYTALESAQRAAAAGRITLGAQNMCWEDTGQYTGEISPLMLKEVGVEIIEIGHSERRHVLHETDEEENKKVLCALRHGLTPLLCIGETEAQKEYGISDEILRMQLKIGLHGVSGAQAEKLCIAYEPVWAIGVHGKPADSAYVQARHAAIREALVQVLGAEAGMRVPILYGGNVNNENAVPLAGLPNVNGLFVGRNAWDAENFSRIIHDVMANRVHS